MSPFLNLPSELRLKIYHYLSLAPSITLPRHTSLSAQLLRTNKFINNEGTPILYSSNTFISTLTSKSWSDSPRQWINNLIDYKIKPENHDTSLFLGRERVKVLVRNLVICAGWREWASYRYSVPPGTKIFIPFYLGFEGLRRVELRIKAFAPLSRIAVPSDFPAISKGSDISIPDYRDFIHAFLALDSKPETRVVVWYHISYSVQMLEEMIVNRKLSQTNTRRVFRYRVIEKADVEEGYEIEFVKRLASPGAVWPRRNGKDYIEKPGT